MISNSSEKRAERVGGDSNGLWSQPKFLSEFSGRERSGALRQEAESNVPQTQTLTSKTAKRMRAFFSALPPLHSDRMRVPSQVFTGELLPELLVFTCLLKAVAFLVYFVQTLFWK